MEKLSELEKLSNKALQTRLQSARERQHKAHIRLRNNILIETQILQIRIKRNVPKI